MVRIVSQSYLRHFVTGIIMGICDTVPGISGGTIALLAGIYHKLLHTMQQFNISLFKNILLYPFSKDAKQQVQQRFKDIDFLFVFTLFSGIAIAILLFSRLITFLLEHFEAQTLSFFVGLIIAATYYLFQEIHSDEHKKGHMSQVAKYFILLGAIVGISITFIVPISPAITLAYMFLAGFLGASAMFLPGLSGAFILLLLGVYEFTLNAVHDPLNFIPEIAIFICGLAAGVLLISRIVDYLFHISKEKTLYTLVGLVIGSLLMPLQKIYLLATAANMPIGLISTNILLALLAIIIVVVVQRSAKVIHR